MIKTCFNCKYGNREGMKMHCSEPTMKPIYDEIFASSLLMHSPDRIYTCMEWKWDEITDKDDELARTVPQGMAIDGIRKTLDHIICFDHKDRMMERIGHLLHKYVEIIENSGRSCKQCDHVVLMDNGMISCELMSVDRYYCNQWKRRDDK